MLAARNLLRFLVSVVCVALLFPFPAHAEQSDLSIVAKIETVAVPDGFGLDLDLIGTAVPQLILLEAPYRVALDFPETLAAAKLPDIKRSKLVSGIRHGLIANDRYRLVLTLPGPVRPELKTERTEAGARISLRLHAGTRKDFVGPSVAAPSKQAERRSATAPHRFVVVLDPGHGGIDKGATGQNGAEEKTVNLAFAKALRHALKPYENVDVVMTREDDVFIPLNERAAIARRAGANLMISLHADSIRYSELRGATVYTLSDKASDSLARELADVENSADRFAGPEWDQDAPEIHDILVDLVRRETEGLSEHFAVRLVADLQRGEVRLINNPKRSAGFRVLRAPDVPSILLEMGYLSNADDEKLLTSSDWQGKLATILARSIGDFSARAGTMALGSDR
ncbi:N-acetylmuramoyl-L-alanine amidase [Aureimonas sp. ME7]|uniref:N-acetylmuramoyl-L-alanine amidase n=1 Tax=Aureimonas sp. ME7 TaxID=2744252 RepID=UPI0015F39A7B|nr:N-acetylmuramoyl-L-alanine amidase [Aureimonas sp. ME7]